MGDQTQKIPINMDLRPAYYDDFHCLAQGCRFSCCKGWGIPFDKKDYLSLKRESGSPELNAAMESGLRRIRKGPLAGKYYGEFDMDGGVCPLLREDGLCRLQSERGHAALPLVCRQYPRGEEYLLSGYLERSLSPSCEAVLELLWNLPEGIEFRSDPLPREERRDAAIPPSESLLPHYAAVREWCIDRLQDRRLPLPERIFLMGLGLRELAEGETDIPRWLERAALLAEQAEASGLLPEGNPELVLFLSNCVRVLTSVQNADPVLREVPREVAEGLGLKREPGTMTLSTAAYREARARFGERFRDREYFMENLMTTVFFHLRLPRLESPEALWKSYVNFCSLYAMYRFLAVMSCREGVEDSKAELFRLTVFASRALIHNNRRQEQLRDELFQNDSATLAHMAILLCG